MTLSLYYLPEKMQAKLSEIFGFGGDQPEYLGHGSFGTAYALPDGTVLKLTADKTEAEAMFLVSKAARKLETVVNVLSVYELRSDRKLLGYAINEDRLSKPSKKIQDMIVFFKNYTIYWDKAGPLTKQLVDDFANNWKATSAKMMLKRIPSEDVVNSFVMFLHKAAEELKFLGIGFQDYHLGNIMMNSNGNPVFIDLGISKIKNKVKLDTLEACVVRRLGLLASGLLVTDDQRVLENKTALSAEPSGVKTMAGRKLSLDEAAAGFRYFRLIPYRGSEYAKLASRDSV